MQKLTYEKEESNTKLGNYIWIEEANLVVQRKMRKANEDLELRVVEKSSPWK